MGDQSNGNVVYAAIYVKAWRERCPTVDEVRPCRCPSCDAAARPLGGALGLVGHGLRPRQARGPSAPEAAPAMVTVDARRYRCRRCGAVVTVLPRGLVRARHFSAGAIALALYLFGVERRTEAETRRYVAPGRSHEHRWASLHRWQRAIDARRLFGGAVRAPPDAWTCRQRAERTAGSLAARVTGRDDATMAERAFAGAARAA